jgi:hypothetical protein
MSPVKLHEILSMQKSMLVGVSMVNGQVSCKLTGLSSTKKPQIKSEAF